MRKTPCAKIGADCRDVEMIPSGGRSFVAVDAAHSFVHSFCCAFVALFSFMFSSLRENSLDPPLIVNHPTPRSESLPAKTRTITLPRVSVSRRLSISSYSTCPRDGETELRFQFGLHTVIF